MPEPVPAPKPYVVTGRHQAMRITYNCPTAESALGKLRAFAQSDYTAIAVTGPDGGALGEADLVALVDEASAGGAPIDIDAPLAPVLVA